MIAVEELLNPISADSPCGEDLSYDPRFIALDTLVAGKPETQFSPAEEPDWKALREACLELLERSKHLRVAMILSLALVNLEGASGLCSGLTLLKGLLERYWPDLYPRLDPEENNDPTERVNILSSLATPLGSYGDPIQFLRRLRRIPLTNSPQLGRLSLADIAGDTATLPGGEGKSPISPAQVEAAFRDTSADQLAATARAITDSTMLARSIDNFLTETVGAERAPDMSPLISTLNEIEKCLSPYLPKTFAQTPVQIQAETLPGPAGQGPSESGAIQSREDVIRVLERICQYYERNEPSSPLPLFLRRAQKLVEMNFLQIIDELTPEARAHLETIVGIKSGEGD